MGTDESLDKTAQPDEGPDATLGPDDQPVPTLRLLYSRSIGILTPQRAKLRSEPSAWRIDSRELRIGRGAPPSEVCLADDSQLSRLHASVKASGLQVVLRDLGSSNGCFVGGTRTKEAVLQDGDIIRCGGSLFIFRCEPTKVPDAKIDSLIGQSLLSRRLRHEIALFAPTQCTVLLLGESGTGKEVTARALHTLSGVAGPLIAVNCAAIPETLAESQLFGHVAGAFTGAKAHAGYFRAAHHGTLFLDEVGELPASLQPKLLRALEEGVITPVGSVEPQPCKVRLIAATNRHLQSEVADGKLRGDLYARLVEIVLRLPPLRARREDILLLLAHFLGDGPPLHPALAEALLLYRWPWNVRELAKVATELKLRGAKLPQLQLDLVADRLTTDAAEPKQGAAAEPVTQAARPATPQAKPADPVVIRRDELLAVLKAHGGRIAHAARQLGKSRQQIYRLLELHGLSKNDFRDDERDGNGETS